MKKILYILFVLVSFASCKKNTITEIKQGQVLILVNSEKISATTSKAISDNGFTKQSVIGMFSKSEDEPIVDLVNVKDANFGYEFTDMSTYLKPINSAKTILFENGKRISIYGYHPFSETSENVSVNTVGEKIVTFNVANKQNTTTDLLMNDFMYAKCSGVYQESPIANMSFKHLMCKITFKIAKGTNWQSNPALNSVSISGANIPKSAKLRLVDSLLTVDTPTESNKISWSLSGNVSMQLSASSAQVVELLTLPCNAGGTVFEFVLASGEKFQYAIQPIEFKSATNVIYNVTLNNRADLPIEISTPSIKDWSVEQVVDITPN